MQQYLPFTVLKLNLPVSLSNTKLVATVPTVYGIETLMDFKLISLFNLLQQYLPFTVLKLIKSIAITYLSFKVATVPTVYGIETGLYLAMDLSFFL